MALQKQAVPVNFEKGLQQKVDPNQLPLGNFISLINGVQDKQGLLQKRNGYTQLASLPNDSYSYLTTFNSNLTAISNNLAAYIAGQKTWVTKGAIQPVQVSTLPLIRSNTNQSYGDIAISANNLICIAYTDAGVVKYSVADATTGQNVIEPTIVTAPGATVSGSPRAFYLGTYFVILFSGAVGGTNHLYYIAINTVSLIVNAAVSLSSNYNPTTQVSYDAVIANGSLYIAWAAPTAGVNFAYLTSTLSESAVVNYPTVIASIMSVCADLTGSLPIIYANFFDNGSLTAYTIVVDNQLHPISGPTAYTPPGLVLNIASVAQNKVCTVFSEIDNAYSFTPPANIQTDYINSIPITQAGVVGAYTILDRGVGIASKAVLINGVSYLLASYQSAYQSSYFLLDEVGNVIAKLAYENGGGYLTTGLPNAIVSGTTISVPYLFKDLIEAVNKNTNVPSGTQVNGIYSQTGINMATLDITTVGVQSSEIGNNLNITGGFLWSYDGYTPVEQNFFIYPENFTATFVSGAGNVTAQQYFYQITYEWTDNQGNAFRSAPSIPVTVTATGTGHINLSIPTLRLTYKIANPVKIVIYRWSVGQQSYYQTTSISSPLLNDPTIDSVNFSDVNSDTTILGNNLIYTTGGVVEDVNGPAATAVTLFDTRLWLIDAEDQNLLWFSKQVIEGTPVEMSDLFTFYVAPSTGTGGSTGVMKCLAPMDDKLIIFKEQAIYYINGTGPDNTGANNQYSQPIFITSTVGCSNQYSIVLTPQGLMFQSENGIWLLGRDLSTTYIGAPVEDSNSADVLSSINVPESTQVRFNLNNNTTLCYNWYFNQWSSFAGIAPISSIAFEGLCTFIDALGRTFQESPGSYLDGANPVLISLQTAWFNLMGLQGFQRFYYMQMSGTYYSPHTLQISYAYDYALNPIQSTTIRPNNYSAPWGGDASWGSNQDWGGALPLEQWQIFPQVQKCQAVSIYIQEQFDSSFQTRAGAGFTLSGLNLVVGAKKGYFKLPASRQAG